MTEPKRELLPVGPWCAVDDPEERPLALIHTLLDMYVYAGVDFMENKHVRAAQNLIELWEHNPEWWTRFDIFSAKGLIEWMIEDLSVNHCPEGYCVEVVPDVTASDRQSTDFVLVVEYDELGGAAP